MLMKSSRTSIKSGIVMAAAHPKVIWRVVELSPSTASTDFLTRRGIKRGKE